MNDDIVHMQSRFIHLTSMDDVASHFTQPTDTDEALVLRILKSNAVARTIVMEVDSAIPLPFNSAFRCTVTLENGQAFAVPAPWWRTDGASFGTAESVQTYRIGDHEWCTAVVEWRIVGAVKNSLFDRPVPGAVSWTPSVLFSLNTEEPRLTILRSSAPQPAGGEVLDGLDLAALAATDVETALIELQQAAAPAAVKLPHQLRGLPRAYEGALLRNAGICLGDTSAG
ncbi:hypothetical protein [Streptomyces sp. NPDC001480]|uniref:hypothetical protein n=1 Tax=Streptomyces sp. NPDC001480 TaxID=3364577 RepID=UPI00367AE2AE